MARGTEAGGGRSRARALPCFFSRRASRRLACSLVRRNRQVASEKAHLGWAVPILWAPVPFFFPAASWAPRNRPRAAEHAPRAGEAALSSVCPRRVRR